MQLCWTEINRVPGALERVMDLLDDPLRCPKYVARVQSELKRPGRAAEFWRRVEQRFVFETTIGGIALYRRIDVPVSLAALLDVASSLAGELGDALVGALGGALGDTSGEPPDAE